MPCAMEMPVNMETEESTETPAAVTSAVKTPAVTAEPCLTPDTVMEDRGVDLSFDSTEAPRVRVKPELGEAVMRTDKLVMPSDPHRDQIKQECDNSQGAVKQESHILASPGGRLKIFQSKYKNLSF